MHTLRQMCRGLRWEILKDIDCQENLGADVEDNAKTDLRVI